MFDGGKPLLTGFRCQKNHHAFLTDDGVVVVAAGLVQPFFGVAGEVEIVQTDLDISIFCPVLFGKIAIAVYVFG